MCTKGVFQIQPPISGVNFSNNMSVPPYNMTETLKLLNLSTINLKDESFLNSLELSGVNLQVDIPPWSGKIFRFTVFTLLENAFCETPSPSVCSDHQSPHVQQSHYKFSTQNLSRHEKHFLEKSPSSCYPILWSVEETP